MGAWGLGSLAYNSGYLGYYNPYYGSGAGYGYGGGGGYSYAQPIPVNYGASASFAANAQNSADDILNAAVAAFKQPDYDAALDIINKGLAQYSNDSVMHEFRSLVLFARGDYQQAATTIHSVLAVGPGWDWTTLASLYANIALYTDHLRALEAFTKANPQDGASRFLLAYHYMSGGHSDAAARKFQEVVTLVPGDRVAADMLKMIAALKAVPTAEAGQQPTPQPPDGPQSSPRAGANSNVGPAAAPIDLATLVGTWKAAREEGSTFELTLTPEKTFTWKFSPKGQPPQEFTGKYTLDVNVLALEKKDGGSLIAVVKPGNTKAFNFKLVGGPPEDKGLDFSR